MIHSKTIEGVPDSITRDQYLSLIAALGFDVNELRGLQLQRDCIVATIKAKRPDGRYLIEHGQLMFHDVYIPVVDPPPADPAPARSSLGGIFTDAPPGTVFDQAPDRPGGAS